MNRIGGPKLVEKYMKMSDKDFKEVKAKHDKELNQPSWMENGFVAGGAEGAGVDWGEIHTLA